jgi:hypothetical protein
MKLLVSAGRWLGGGRFACDTGSDDASCEFSTIHCLLLFS